MYFYECAVVIKTFFSLSRSLNSHQIFHKYNDYDVRIKIFLYINVLLFLNI
jgi:hypothetical protein